MVGSFAAVIGILPLLAAAAVAADPVTVRSGDTLTSIARRSGVSIERIVHLNGITDPNRIYVGQQLRLEDAAAPATDTTRGEAVHVVRRGETTWGIAMHYGTSVAAIAEANGLSNPSRIFGGMRLVIPGAAATDAAPAPAAASAAPTPVTGGEVVHVVRRGESTWGIAMHYGTSVAAIAEANGLSNPSRIFGGMRLVIPGGTPAPRAGQPARPLPAAMAAAVAERDDVRRLITAEAERFGVPVSLALALAWQESGWRQSAVSYLGAIGVMQLLPSTAEWVATTMLHERVNVHDVRDNVRAGVRLIAHYLARYDGNVELTLAAYYQGQAGTDRHGVYSMSRTYVGAIQGLQKLFGG
jgi:soluble lytic murein transglycosylase-like protein